MLFAIYFCQCFPAEHLVFQAGKQLLPEVFYREFLKSFQQLLYFAALLQQLIDKMGNEHRLIVILQCVERFSAV